MMMLSGRIEFRSNMFSLLLVFLAVLLLLLLGLSGPVLRSDVLLGLVNLLAGLLLTLALLLSLRIELSNNRRDLSLPLLSLLSFLSFLSLGTFTFLRLGRLITKLDIITMTIRDLLTTRASKAITSLSVLDSPSEDVLSNLGLLEVLGRCPGEGSIRITSPVMMIDQGLL